MEVGRGSEGGEWVGVREVRRGRESFHSIEWKLEGEVRVVSGWVCGWEGLTSTQSSGNGRSGFLQ